jgi:hypothetical protein
VFILLFCSSSRYFRSLMPSLTDCNFFDKIIGNIRIIYYHGGLCMVVLNRLLIIMASVTMVSSALAQGNLSDKVTDNMRKASAYYTAAHAILEPVYVVPAGFVGASIAQLKKRSFGLAGKNALVATALAGAVVLYRNRANINFRSCK